MQASIETRVPFLDPAVVALALNLPLEARTRPLRKGVLRDLDHHHLSRSVARRAKVGFGFDVRRYLDPATRPEFLAEGAARAPRRTSGRVGQPGRPCPLPPRAAAVDGRGVVPPVPRRRLRRGGRTRAVGLISFRRAAWPRRRRRSRR